MKYFIIVPGLILLLAGSIFAEQSMKLGIMGGISISDQNWAERFNGHREGFSFGLFLERPVWKKLYISPEIHFVQKGTKGLRLLWTDYYHPLGAEIIEDYRFDYLSVRFMIKQYMNIFGSPCYFGIGPDINILLNKNKEAELIVEDRANSDFERMVFGVAFVVGQTIKITDSKAIIIEASYCGDISVAARNILFEESIKNRSLQIMIGLIFDIGK